MQLLQKIKDGLNKGLDKMSQNFTLSILAIMLLAVGSAKLYGKVQRPSVLTPSSVSDYANTSVMIMDKAMSSGGSGVILRSTKTSSEILTNKHVCKLLQSGGVVSQFRSVYIVDSIKRYPNHDLCLVKVAANLHVNTKVANDAPTIFEESLISGHPSLLPHVLTRGNFSGHQIIQLLVGLRECTKEDYNGQYGLYCAIIGGFPILQSFDAQLSTGTILPGSSGSGVFNKAGEISGLVFAGNGSGLGYAYIVPWEYIADFVAIEKSIKYEPVQQLKYDAMIRSVFNVQKECLDKTEDSEQYVELCKSTQKYLIQEIK